jgi:hypothetical protein
MVVLQTTMEDWLSINPVSMSTFIICSCQWSVGAPCRAVYTEDGVVYEAVVRSIDPVTRSAVVRYRGYGNEEEQCLDDLLPSLLHHTTTPIDQLSVATERGVSVSWDCPLSSLQLIQI